MSMSINISSFTEKEAKQIIGTIPVKVWSQLTPHEHSAMNVLLRSNDKQIPTKVNNLEYAVDIYGDCPRCDTHFHLDRDEVVDVKYCIKCGQRLDWGLGV